jgi:molybdopterin-guanine dinucleotide biosynthesis protein A
MGADKATLTVGQSTWSAHASACLLEYTESIYISVGPEPSRNPRALSDDILDIGPAAGLLRAARERPGRDWVVLAVDFPLATAQSLGDLVEAHHKFAQPITCYQHPDLTPEPLFAVWSARALAALKENVARGLTGPMATLKAIGHHALDPYEVSVLKNMNTPEQWRQALAQS